MNYLKAENLTKIYGDKVLFENIDLSINKGQKVALIARNGTGKSSLLKIIVGLDSSDKGGTVRIHKSVKVGYLEQSPELAAGMNVMEAVFYSDNPSLQAVKAYEEAINKQENFPSAKNQANLEKAMAKMQLLNAWDYEAKIKEILSRFNITRLNQPVEELSGGETKRVALASLLIQEPDFIVLDEPTNHLDLTMIEWLENYLKRANLTILLVTHDRYFLDRVCTEIIEIDRGKTQKYRGNYTYFLEKKAELTFNLKQEIDKAGKLMKKELQWIRTQPKARGTKAKSRVSAFDSIKDKATMKLNEKDIDFSAVKMARIGGKTIEMYHINKGYDGVKLLDDFSYVFKRRDRVGIIGKNGAGKSTFLNMLVGSERPDEGKIVRGTTLVFGYYHQQGLQLKDDKLVIDVIRDIAEVLPLEKGKYLTAGQILDHFDFPFSKHQNYVSTLSGGEQRRLYLLSVLMQNPNFLILDEPTNDLDLLTLNVLEDFLLKFKGCLIIVSHDRYFMDKLVEHVFVFEGNGKIRDFPGNYTQYRDRKQQEIKEERERKEAEKANSQKKKAEVKKVKTKTKLSYNEKREFERLEQEIEDLEMEKEVLENKLNAGQSSHEDLMKWATRLGEIVELVDEKSDRWLELSELI